jgi:hypothetical protein
MGSAVTRISLRPSLTGLPCLFQVSRYEHVIEGSDEELFGIAHVIAQLPGSTGAFGREVRLIDIGVHTRERGMRHPEARIDVDGMPEKGQSSGGAA